MNERFQTRIEKIIEKDARYKGDAYAFVMEALSFTQRKFKASRHVTGEQILDGISELLMKKYGPMTMTILNHWGIASTEDFGNLVFNLVDHDILSKTEDDTITAFKDRFDFDEVFKKQYHKRLHQKISRMRSV